MSQAEFRHYLIAMDVPALRRHWRLIFPDQAQPGNDAATMVQAHMARLMMENMPIASRLYSYSWLHERGYPTDLPPSLSKHRDYIPKTLVGSVGISVGRGFLGDGVTPENLAVRGAMENAVLETYADGHANEPEKVKARMMEARAREKRGLGLA